MQNIFKKISMVLGYLFLWIAISGAYQYLTRGKALVDILTSVWLVLLIGLILRWISQIGKAKYKRITQIIDDISIIFIIRGILGFITYYSPISLIFIIIGAIGLLIIKMLKKGR